MKQNNEPSEGTTPQAERPMNIEEAKRRFPEDFSHICQASCSNPCMVIDDARAVAPVETPRDCSNCGHPLPCHCDDVGWGAAPVQTRLTAEQFYEQDWANWDTKRDEDDSFWTTVFAFAEAYIKEISKYGNVK